jgi:hypothetical protein
LRLDEAQRLHRASLVMVAELLDAAAVELGRDLTRAEVAELLARAIARQVSHAA